MIKAVLFDMDGVLIDAKDWHYEALNRALDLFGMAIDRDSHLATFDGLPTRRKLEILSKTRDFPPRLQAFVNKLKQAYTAEIIYSHCRPVFHHQYALARLKRDGIKLAVCSNSVRQTVALMMSLARLESFLDLQLSNEDVARSKPDPEIYLKAMAHLFVSGMQPGNPLYMDDMTFVGHCRDLRAIVAMPLIFGIRYSRLAPEQWFWTPPFASLERVLDAYYRVQVGLIFNDENGNEKLHAVLKRSPLFARAVALGLRIFRQHFAFLPWPVEGQSDADVSGFSLEELLWTNTNLPDLLHNPSARFNSVRGQWAIDAIANREFKPSAFGDAAGAMIERYCAPGGPPAPDDHDQLLAESVALGEAIEAGIGIKGMKHFRRYSHHTVIDGAAPTWKLGQLGTEVTAQLEHDNNVLRRTVDQLNQRLAELERTSTS